MTAHEFWLATCADEISDAAIWETLFGVEITCEGDIRRVVDALERNRPDLLDRFREFVTSKFPANLRHFAVFASAPA